METSSKKNIIEVGLDEVARGCMFGRVYTAAVIWPQDYSEDPNYITRFNYLKKRRIISLYYNTALIGMLTILKMMKR